MSAKFHSKKLQALEAEYTALLLTALEACANGQWGLFAQNDAVVQKLGKHARKSFASTAAEELIALGEDIGRLRDTLGYSEAFPPHARLMRTRTQDRENAPAEPSLARQWLAEMRSE